VTADPTKVLAYQQLGLSEQVAEHLARQDMKLEVLKDDVQPAIKLAENMRWLGIAILVPFLAAIGGGAFLWISR